MICTLTCFKALLNINISNTILLGKINFEGNVFLHTKCVPTHKMCEDLRTYLDDTINEVRHSLAMTVPHVPDCSELAGGGCGGLRHCHSLPGETHLQVNNMSHHLNSHLHPK